MSKKQELIDIYNDEACSINRSINKKDFPKSIFFILFSLPIILFLLSISENSTELINKRIQVFLIACLFVGLVFLIYKSYIFIKNKDEYSYSLQRLSRSLALVISVFVLCLSFSFTLYADTSFKDWLIKKAMNTSDYQHLATWFYDRASINNIIKNIADESIRSNDDLLSITDLSYKPKKFANKYEEDLFLKKNEDDIYKIVPVSGTVHGSDKRYSGWMTIVYDPADVKLALSQGAGTEGGNYGEILSILHQKSGALVSMNAGGFYDPDWRSNGGIPHGDIIKDGEIVSSYHRGIDSGGMVGFDKDNRLILKRINGEQALEMGIRDAVDWGPYLIVNGKDYFPNKTTYSWAVSRTAIGQRADGIVLLLVIDGMQAHSHGASYNDLSSLFLKYGAVNAASMDGGTSTSMYSEGRFLNNPFNGHVRTIRQLPNAWIVKRN